MTPYILADGNAIETTDGKRIAIVITDDNWQEHAAFIVKACNSHADLTELLGLCKTFLNMYEMAKTKNTTVTITGAFIDSMRTAVSKAS